MSPEIELQFLPRGNAADDVTLLLQHGFELTLTRTLMRRQMFTLPGITNNIQRARVRDEGNKITMTTKRVEHVGIDGTYEAEVVVTNFDESIAFLKALGLKPGGFQENYCTRWENPAGTEVSFTEWPGLPGYFEIEGPTAHEVYDVLERILGYNRHTDDIIIAGNTAIIYHKLLGVSQEEIWQMPSITFANPPQRR